MRVDDERIKEMAQSGADDMLSLIAQECWEARDRMRLSEAAHKRTYAELEEARAEIEKKEAELTALRAYIATHNAPVHDPLRQYWVHRGPCGEDGCH